MNTAQIAAEAWSKIRPNAFPEENIAIIQEAIERAQKENFKMIATLKEELTSRAAQAGECNHEWTDYYTLHMPEQGPPLEIESCVRCGVQRKKQ